jgi:hypothetical protein
MSTFVSAEIVQRIHWDFTNTPSVERGELVEHEQLVGTLVEPDFEQAGAFLDAYEKFLEENISAARAAYARERILDQRAAGIDFDDEPDSASLPEIAASSELYVTSCEIGREALVGVGVPEDLVAQLPPRVLLAFLRHVNKELSGEGDAASSTSS